MAGPQAGDEPRGVLMPFDEAQSRYLEAIRAPYRTYEEGAKTAYEQYVNELRSAWVASDPQRMTVEAYKRYVAKLEEAWDKSRVRPQLEEAYRSYLKDLKAAFEQLELNGFGPQHLSIVGHSILSAMWYCRVTYPALPGSAQPPAIQR